ncbi:MAG: hypothetical protein FWD15_04915 [Alphaproteobacteria bacterium]|nr:hypothetical protein [Alphaproteobacteria bacterium]
MEYEHDKIWTTIDRMALLNGISVSALAKKAGLDATAFNKSKRFYPCGKRRWPSTESVCKVMRATNSDWRYFIDMMASCDCRPSVDELKQAA